MQLVVHNNVLQAAAKSNRNKGKIDLLEEHAQISACATAK